MEKKQIDLKVNVIGDIERIDKIAKEMQKIVDVGKFIEKRGSSSFNELSVSDRKSSITQKLAAIDVKVKRKEINTVEELDKAYEELNGTLEELRKDLVATDTIERNILNNHTRLTKAILNRIAAQERLNKANSEVKPKSASEMNVSERASRFNLPTVSVPSEVAKVEDRTSKFKLPPSISEVETSIKRATGLTQVQAVPNLQVVQRLYAKIKRDIDEIRESGISTLDINIKYQKALNASVELVNKRLKKEKELTEELKRQTEEEKKKNSVKIEAPAKPSVPSLKKEFSEGMATVKLAQKEGWASPEQANAQLESLRPILREIEASGEKVATLELRLSEAISKNIKLIEKKAEAAKKQKEAEEEANLGQLITLPPPERQLTDSQKKGKITNMMGQIDLDVKTETINSIAVLETRLRDVREEMQRLEAAGIDMEAMNIRVAKSELTLRKRLEETESAARKRTETAEAAKAAQSGAGQFGGNFSSGGGTQFDNQDVDKYANYFMSQAGYIVQDAPYGFRGIANNISQTVGSFDFLKKSVEKYNIAARAAGKGNEDMISVFDVLKNSLKGPGGLIFLMGSVLPSAILFAMEAWRMYEESQDKLASSTVDFVPSITKLGDALYDIKSEDLGEEFQLLREDLIPEGVKNSISEVTSKISELKSLLTQVDIVGSSEIVFFEGSKKIVKSYKDIENAIDNLEIKKKNMERALSSPIFLELAKKNNEVENISSYVDALKDKMNELDESAGLTQDGISDIIIKADKLYKSWLPNSKINPFGNMVDEAKAANDNKKAIDIIRKGYDDLEASLAQKKADIEAEIVTLNTRPAIINFEEYSRFLGRELDKNLTMLETSLRAEEVNTISSYAKRSKEIKAMREIELAELDLFKGKWTGKKAERRKEEKKINKKYDDLQLSLDQKHNTAVYNLQIAKLNEEIRLETDSAKKIQLIIDRQNKEELLANISKNKNEAKLKSEVAKEKYDKQLKRDKEIADVEKTVRDSKYSLTFLHFERLSEATDNFRTKEKVEDKTHSAKISQINEDLSKGVYSTIEEYNLKIEEENERHRKAKLDIKQKEAQALYNLENSKRQQSGEAPMAKAFFATSDKKDLPSSAIAPVFSAAVDKEREDKLKLLEDQYTADKAYTEASMQEGIDKKTKLLDLERQYVKDKIAINQEGFDAQAAIANMYYSTVNDSLMGTLTFMGASEETMFNVSKFANAGQAIMNSELAFTKTLAAGGAYATPIAWATRAAGIASAYRILSQKYGSTSSGGSGSGNQVFSYRGFNTSGDNNSNSQQSPIYSNMSFDRANNNSANNSKTEMVIRTDDLGSIVAKGTLANARSGKSDLRYWNK